VNADDLLEVEILDSYNFKGEEEGSSESREHVNVNPSVINGKVGKSIQVNENVRDDESLNEISNSNSEHLLAKKRNTSKQEHLIKPAQDPNDWWSLMLNRAQPKNAMRAWLNQRFDHKNSTVLPMKSQSLIGEGHHSTFSFGEGNEISEGSEGIFILVICLLVL
jgi:hypothetical protein